MTTLKCAPFNGKAMTPEERVRMNALCLQIQQERNYDTFEELSRQLRELVTRKEQRFPERRFYAPEPTAKAWRVMPAIVKQIFPQRHPLGVERVEITIPDAEDLFREIRIENSFVNANGTLLTIKPAAKLDVKLEATADSFVQKTSGHQ